MDFTIIPGPATQVQPVAVGSKDGYGKIQKINKVFYMLPTSRRLENREAGGQSMILTSRA